MTTNVIEEIYKLTANQHQCCDCGKIGLEGIKEYRNGLGSSWWQCDRCRANHEGERISDHNWVRRGIRKSGRVI